MKSSKHILAGIILVMVVVFASSVFAQGTPTQSPQTQKDKPKILPKAGEKELQMAPEKQKTIQSTLPDLICESILTSPKNPMYGDIMGPIVVTIKNKGLSTAPPSKAAFGCPSGSCYQTECVGCTVTMDDTGRDEQGKVLMWSKIFLVPSIKPGNSVQFTFRPVPDVQPGNVRAQPKWLVNTILYCRVDSERSIDEGGEGEWNNEKQIIVPVRTIKP